MADPNQNGYFTDAELACHDGTPYPEEFGDRKATLLSLMNKVRGIHGGPLQVVSCYRTKAYNAKLAGKSEAHQVASGSYHVQGMAADLRPMTGTVQELYQAVLAAHSFGDVPELGGIGIYPVSNWIHIDCGVAPDGHLRRWQGT